MPMARTATSRPAAAATTCSPTQPGTPTARWRTTLTINLGDAAPGNIVIPPPNTPGQTLVFEAGLAARGVEPAGSHAGDPSTPVTTSGTITFTSPDGVSKIELGGLVLTVSGTPQTITDPTGRLTASYAFNALTGQGTISYSYTLLDNTVGIPSVNFAVAITDADGDRTPGGNLTITITDDAPVAVADADAVAAGQLTAETGNVLTGAGTTSGAASADIQGADGAAVAGRVERQRAESTRDRRPPGTIAIPPGNTPGQTQVFEAGLHARGAEPAGSHAGSASFPTTSSGTITFTSPYRRLSIADFSGFTINIQRLGARLGKPDYEWRKRYRQRAQRDDVKRCSLDGRRGLEIVEQEAHCRQQLIIGKNDHAARRSQRNGRAEVLVFGIQKVDQRASSDLVFLAVDGDGFLLGHQLASQGGDAVRRDCSRRPGFVDCFQRIALQAGMAHRFFCVALGHLVTVPGILAAAENIPGHDNLARKVVAPADDCIDVIAARRAALQQHVWN